MTQDHDDPARARRALVTGVAGQDGMLLARRLCDLGWSVLGTSRPGVRNRLSPYLTGVQLAELDIRDQGQFGALLRSHKPDWVVNFAGFSSVGRSWEDPALVHATNVVAVTDMLHQIAKYRDQLGQAPKFFQASSAEIFGLGGRAALDENSQRNPLSPYAESKVLADQAVAEARRHAGLFACSGILFNHESPFRGPQFLAGTIARAAAQEKSGNSGPPLCLGTLDAVRDWGAAVDHVAAIDVILQQAQADDYIIATGAGHTVRHLVASAFDLDDDGASLPDGRRVTIDSALWNAERQPHHVVGNPDRLNSLGWSPQVPITTLMRSMVRVESERLRTSRAESPSYLTLS